MGGDESQCHGLDEDVADGGGFGGTGVDRDSAGVGGELRQRNVIASAPEDMKPVDWVGRNLP